MARVILARWHPIASNGWGSGDQHYELWHLIAAAACALFPAVLLGWKDSA
jgi:hypothetical protein